MVYPETHCLIASRRTLLTHSTSSHSAPVPAGSQPHWTRRGSDIELCRLPNVVVVSPPRQRPSVTESAACSRRVMGAAVPKPLQRRRALEETVQLTCPKCANVMDVIPRVPGLGHLANRIFECRRCGEIQVAPSKDG
jgi:hypothetical protein